MKTKELATPPGDAGNIIDEETFLARVPISPRTARYWRTNSLIPFIRPPGTKRVLYHWPSVQSALLRMQQGGVQ